MIGSSNQLLTNVSYVKREGEGKINESNTAEEKMPLFVLRINTNRWDPNAQNTSAMCIDLISVFVKPRQDGCLYLMDS